MKKIFALLLVCTLLLGLMAGCGSTAAESAAAPAESVASVASEAEAPAAAAAEDIEEDSAEEASVIDIAEEPVEEVPGDPVAAMAEEFITYPLNESENTITMWYYIPPYVEFMDSNNSFNALPAAEAATGIHLDFTEVSSSSAATAFNLMVASGDMTDLIPVSEYYSGGLSKAYDEDIIMDIGEYVAECMPNYAAVLAELDDKTAKATLTEGRTLAFYRIKDGTFANMGLVTRQDWIEAQGWEWSGQTVTLDELTTYLKTMKDAYNVSTPIYNTDGKFAIQAAFDTEIPILVSNGFMSIPSSTIFRYDDEVTSGWVTDGYREYLEWVLEMMDAGIFPVDYLSLDTNQGVMNKAIASGNVAIWSAGADKIDEIVTYYGQDTPGMAVSPVPRIVKDVNDTYHWNDEAALVTSGGFSLSATCSHPELVCKWQNYFWTDEGWVLSNYGIEGESYHMDGDTPVFDWNKPTTVTGKNAPNAEMAQQLFTMLRFCGFYVDNDMLMSTFTDNAMAAVELWSIEGSDDSRAYPSAAKIGMTTEETEEIASVESDFLTYAEETCMKFLAGELELNDDTWAEYVQTCYDMGLTTVVDVYQGAYDANRNGER